MNIEHQHFMQKIQLEEQKIRNLIRTHINNVALRDDVLQDVLLEAWKSYPKFKRKSTFGTWLYRIALNVIYLTYRKKKRFPKLVNVELSNLNITGKKEAVSPQAEKLYQAIATLKFTEKSIISAHLDGYNNMEIGEIMGLTTNHVGVSLHRIKKQLKAALKK